MRRPRRTTVLCLLLCLLPAAAALPGAASAKGFTLVPTGGYLFFLGGSQEDLEGAPFVGARLEYNFSRDDIMSMGLVYAYTKADVQGSVYYPSPSFLEQHFCFLGYRFGKNWKWFSIGSQVGVGAVVRNKTNIPRVFLVPATAVVWEEGTDAQYAMQLGLFADFRPFSWLSIGPDFTYMMTTDMDQWIFGGDTSRFFRIGGHLSFSF